MAIKPFQWANLKKVSSEEQNLTDSILELLPANRAREKLGVEVRKTLMKHLGEKSFYYLDNLQAKSYADFLGELPDNAILSIIGMEPSSQKAILHIDQNLAFLLIDKLLGGSGEPSVDNRMLTETEQGVVQYLIMQILAQIWQTCGKSSRVHFRFERFCSSAKEIEKIGTAKEAVVILAFKVGIGERAGFVKLIFTKSFIEKASHVTSVPAMFEKSYFVDKIAKYDFIKTSVWADAGHVIINSSDLISLDAGDVVLFDESALTLVENKISGEVGLKVGQGENGNFRAAIEIKDSTVKCTIIGD